MTIKKVHTSNIDQVIDRWFESGNEGDWVGVFENQDLGHPDLGRRFAAFYDVSEWDNGEIMKTTGPDSSLGLGWRYLLVEKCVTPEEAKVAMTGDEWSPNDDPISRGDS